jgi:uncharacterized damage-inducible protein DinB
MDMATLFLEKSRFLLNQEYRTKIRAAVDALPAEGLWWRPNEQSNSIGNLLAHLAGNIRQWIVHGVNGAPDVRDRNREFAARSGATALELLADLERALDEVDAVLARLTAADLVKPLMVQGRNLTVLAAVYTVVEHFSMHTGQIILMTKLLAPGAIRFYDDGNGLARPLWPELQGRSRSSQGPQA